MFTSAIVGIGTVIANAKSSVPKNNFFILLPLSFSTILKMMLL